MHLSKTEKDKVFYGENGVITLQQGVDIEGLMLYGWGLTNKTEVKFTSWADDFGNDCKTHDGKYHINHFRTVNINLI